MEDSWRFHSIQGNICPTCSVSHFPFCPQPPPFNPSFQRPHFDPLSNNRGIPRSLSPFDDRSNSFRPITGPPPIDVYNNQINRIHRDGYQPSSYLDYGGHEFNSGEFLESDRTVKRMRVGEMGSGSFSQIPPLPPPSSADGYHSSGTRLSAEDERRLSLIREHGAPSVGRIPQIGADSDSGRGNQLNGYSHESSYDDRQARTSNSFYDSRGGSADRLGQVMHQDPVFDNHNSFYDSRGGPTDRLGQVMHQDPVFDNHNRLTRDSLYDPVFDNQTRVVRDNLYNEKKGFGRGEYALGHDHAYGYSQQKMQGNVEDFQSDSKHSFTSRNEPWHQPHYGHNDESVRSYLQSTDRANALRDASDYVNASRRNGSHQLEAKEFYQSSEFSHIHGNSPLFSGSGNRNYESRQNSNIYGLQNDARQSFEIKHPPVHSVHEAVRPYNSSTTERFGSPPGTLGVYPPPPLPPGASSVYPPPPPLPPGPSTVYPPLPPLPPPSLPMEPPGPPPGHLQARASPPSIPFTSTSAAPFSHQSTFESQPAPLKNPSPEKPKVVNASSLFKRPNRDTRPDYIVVILRGLPGSGKSYLAKMLRDLEVENGANAPRIHSMDDYFMTEVEKVEESESKLSGLVKGKKRVTKKVMEYCYEPEMEEAYRSSMLKAFKKTLEDGTFTFIIVDDRNLRIADFAQFWACAKRSGYEVYLLEAMYKDPVGCAARNIHGFTSDDIKKMAELWEEAPSLYLRLDIQSLFHGDDLKEQGIQEVDMDMDDVASDDDQSGLQNRNSEMAMEQPQQDCPSDDSASEEERRESEENDPGIKELGRSKWLHDADEDDIERSDDAKRASNALSGLIQAYAKGDKSVHWGDQVGKSGFSIGASKRQNVLSLVIGPGAGYNLKSNPLPEEENESSNDTSWQSKKRSAFEEQLRAERASERESFKSVVDRRRRRIGGLEMEDELGEN